MGGHCGRWLGEVSIEKVISRVLLHSTCLKHWFIHVDFAQLHNYNLINIVRRRTQVSILSACCIGKLDGPCQIASASSASHILIIDITFTRFLRKSWNICFDILKS
jgi:hypothetical protein